MSPANSQASGARQLALGAFFVIALGLLAWYTLFLTDFKLFGERHELVVQFSAANGLRQGDPVLVAGIRRGRVGALAFDPSADLSRRITVSMLLDEALELRQGFDIAIEDSTLLGGKQVAIDPGPPGAATVAAGAALQGQVAGNALTALGDLVDGNRERLERILSDIEEVTGNVREGKGAIGRLLSDPALADSLSTGLSRFGAFSDNAALLTGDLREGKGALGRLLTDDDLAAKLGEIGTHLAEITADVRTFTADLAEGKGLLPRLAKDEALADNASEALAKVRDIVERIQSGQGNLGRLVVDEAAMRRVESVLQKLDEGEGDLGALISRREIYDKLSAVADDLQSASAALRSEQGTLGRLIHDDSLYQDLQRAVGLVIRSLEEYREAAPVTTFTSVLFGAF